MLRMSFAKSQKVNSMHGTRFRSLLITIGWGSDMVAKRLGIHARQVQRWARGGELPPDAVLVWLERLAACIEAHPAPGYQDDSG